MQLREMEKIDREALKITLKVKPYERTDSEDRLIEEAATILLKITDPEFVPSEGMLTAAETNKTELLSLRSIFRAMMKELVE
jgi:hypothetical protein